MRKAKIVVDQALANRADVYLGMWKALESFDPDQDRWSKPTDFGSQHDRIEAAENAISVMESRYADCVDDTLRNDICHFRRMITGFKSEQMMFTESVAEFCEHLGNIGTALAYECLKQAETAGP